MRQKNSENAMQFAFENLNRQSSGEAYIDPAGLAPLSGSMYSALMRR